MLALVTLAFTVVYFGLRDPWGSGQFLGDTPAYTRYFEDLKYNVVTTSKDLGFYMFMKFFAGFTNVTVFYLVCAFIYVYPQYLLSKKIAPKYFFYAFAFIVTSFSFFGFGTNGLRNGLATSLFLLALYLKPKTWRILLLFVIGFSFHSSLVLPIVAFLLSYYVKGTRWLIGIWILLVPVTFLFGANLNLLLENIPFLTDERFNNLYGREYSSDVIRGFRLDFVIYSVIPIALGAWFIFKKNFRDAFYVRIFNIYLIGNSVWLIFMFAAYSNRIAYLSWFLIPIIVMYPLMRIPTWKNQSHVIGTAIIVNLLLTLFLTL